MTDVPTTMTDRQVQLVKSTWRYFRHMDPRIPGQVFYGKLFSSHPELRRKFPVAMDDQYAKFIDMISIIVARIERPESMIPHIERSRVKHKALGIKPIHYKYTGEALLWSLKMGLGVEWTTEVEKAWICCYQEILKLMLRS